MVTFLFSVHTITEAKQYAFDLARPGVVPPLLKRDRARAAAREKQFNKQKVQGLASNKIQLSSTVAIAFF